MNAPESTHTTGLKDKKKMLEAKLSRLQESPEPGHPSFDKAGAIARATQQLAEVERALKEEKK